MDAELKLGGLLEGGDGNEVRETRTCEALPTRKSYALTQPQAQHLTGGDQIQFLGTERGEGRRKSARLEMWLWKITSERRKKEEREKGRESELNVTALLLHASFH